MTSYKKTMREAREEMLQSLNESNLEKMRKAAGGAKQTLKMKDGSIGVDSFTASAIMKIYDQINDRNKKTFENMMKNGKKTDIMKLQKFAMSAVRAVAPAEYSEEFEEEFELDEGTKQVLAHGGKGQYKAVKDGDITKIMHKGKVVGTADFDRGADSFFVSIKGEKGQKSFDDAQAMVNYFAKNKITEEVELDEDIMPLIFGGGIIAALLPVLFMSVREIIRGTPLESSIKKIVDKLKKNKNYKMSDSEKSDVKGFVSKVKKEKPSLLQKAMKKIKEEVELDEAGYVKGKDPLPAGKELADIMKKRRKDRKGKKDKKEEVELEEDIMPLIFGGGIIAGLLPVLYLSAKEIAGPSIGKLVDKLKKNKNYKMSDSEKSDVKGFVSKVKKDKPSLLQKAMKKIKEEVDLDEASYALYHKDFSSAMQHSYKMAKKMYGITIDPKEIDDKVASGPRKPSEGKTNTYRLKGDKGAIQVQVYNKGGSKPFELNMYKEEVELDEVFDFVLLDKDNKIARRYSGSNAKKDAESGKKSAHLPPMSIPKGDVKKMKIVPIAPKDKKGIGDTVLAIGEKLDKEDEPKVKEIIKKLKGASQAHAGQAKDLEKAVKEDSKPINEILPVLARMVAKPIARKVATKAVSKVSKPQEKQESAASDARRAMASDPSTKQKFSKNVSATDDDVKAADKNIIMQMRKAVSLRGNKVEFMDKKKVMIPQKIAQAVITKYNNMKKPADKEKFQSKISKSYKSMLTALKEQNEINNKNNSLDQLKELVKEMKGKNNG